MNPVLLRLRLAGVLAALLIVSPRAFAHCDTMDGPVVLAAKAALAKKDVTPVLKWVKKEAEAEIRDAFTKTVAVRTLGGEARDLADRFFFETLVRVHRAGEGAPFEGLKPAGTELGAVIQGADKALESGDIEPVVKKISNELANGIRQRFPEVREKQAHAEHNVDAGREFVAAYVEYIHYVEGIHQATQGPRSHHEAQHPTAPGAEPEKVSVPEHKH